MASHPEERNPRSGSVRAHAQGKKPAGGVIVSTSAARGLISKHATATKHAQFDARWLQASFASQQVQAKGHRGCIAILHKKAPGVQLPVA
eukprot:scaffold19958_cov30-Tisochrysis_lutea.AAC.1